MPCCWWARNPRHDLLFLPWTQRLIVCGTDTDVGKTVVSALPWFRAEGPLLEAGAVALEDRRRQPKAVGACWPQ